VIQFMTALESDDLVILSHHGPVATILMNSAETGNAIDTPMRRALLDAVTEVAAMDEIRVVVLAGAGDAFSTGGDVGEMSNLTLAEAENLARLQVRLLNALAGLKKPVVAAIKGPCLGVGLEIALCADLRFARDDARLGLPGINLGITPAGSTALRLTQLIGAANARALLMTGSVIDAERAFGLGLVTAALPQDEFDTALEQVAGHMASLSPVAVTELKGLLDLAQASAFKAADKAGITGFANCYREGDANNRWHSVMGQGTTPKNLH